MMVLRDSDLHEGVDRLQAALISGEGLPEALELYARAAGAAGALIVRDIGSEWQQIVHSKSLDLPVRQYMAGDVPPDSRARRVRLSLQDGFLGDFASFAPQELLRDAYYQEFLKAHGLGWHAAALIAEDGVGQTILSLKREAAGQHFNDAELAALNGTLTTIRATASFARALAHAELEGDLRQRARRGAVFRLDGAGRAWFAGGVMPPEEVMPICIAEGVMTAAEPVEQAAFALAVQQASRRPYLFSTLLMTGPDGVHRAIVRLAPVVGRTASLFRETSALLVVSPLGLKKAPSPRLMAELAGIFHLTLAEARVAAHVGAGWPLQDAAQHLGIGVGTLRNHLKQVFTKTGVARQIELSEIIASLAE